ncbi:Methyl-accepting chemotaxis protein [Alkalithermobacter thermoalcaliphilus JW-YL-7 = DSM 7308]|uniref:Methyl-accepting chemotaxis protein n=1 Tax=Alkalithermobacter thermoalcaliphilus JW-YL-7 = DSM 7308 TaxID=1121328 RepID=A0A150FRY9_CLOPD|nr:methyl-accepting chemotaxis sensory transducer [[Clostridium] paradoxum JW-YL-7 = DSM 7308]SHK36858.1 Methyl-accepting chemotaxis protein [[Clostridium] paradoxum JW-YL-7 = DSM 7308]
MKKLLRNRQSIKIKILINVFITFFITMSILTGASIYSINKKMTHQMETLSLSLIESMVSRIENNRQALDAIQELFDQKIVVASKLINSYPNMSNDVLKRLAKELDVAEINISDSNGVIIYSNLDENINYKYPSEHAVSDILSGKSNSVIEDVRQSTVDNNYYKYGAAKLNNGGVVQIGISADTIKTISDSVDVQNILEDIASRDNIVYALVISKDLKAIAHSNKDRIGIQLDDEGSKTAAVEGKSYFDKFYYEPAGAVVFDALVPLYRNGEHIGAVSIGISTKDLTDAIKETIINSIIVALVMFALGFLVLIYLLNRLTKPLNDLVYAADKISNGDLTVNIDIKSNDEVGKVANSFNNMVEKLRSMTGKMKDIAINISSYSEELFSISQQASSVSEQIAMSTQDMAQGSEEQARATADVSENIKNVVSNIESINKEVENVVNTADETGKLAQDGTSKMNNMINQMNTIKNSVNYSSDVIQNLQETSLEIGNIVEVINNIANQTNLLALNAAIEAARAGEAGRGFAVVAEEVRKLAEQSMRSADSIKELIAKTQENTQKALVSINEGNSQAQRGEEIVKQVEAALNEILDGFNDTKDKLYSVSKNVKEANDNAQVIISSVSKIESIAQDAAANSEQIAASTEEQASSIDEIAKSIQMLTDMSKELEDMVSGFKLN